MRRCGTGRGGAAHGIIHDCGTRCSTKPAGRSRGSNRCASSFPTTTAISLPASSVSPQPCAPRAEITVVAPERDRSGASNSLTLDRPLSVRRAPNGFLFVNGTPDRLRASRRHRAARRASRHGDLRHQSRRQHGRRHDLLGHGRGGDRRLPAGHSVDRDIAGVEDGRAFRDGSGGRARTARAPSAADGGPVAPQRQRARRAAHRR